MKDYYSILDVPSNASQDKIRDQYRFLLHAWHPDKFPVPEQKAKAQERTKELNEAYNILSKPAKRAEYDREYSFQSSNFDHTEKDREQKEQKRRAEEAKQHNPEYERQRQEQAEAKRQRAEAKRQRTQAEVQRKKAIARRVRLVGVVILFLGLLAGFVPTWYPDAVVALLQSYWAPLSFIALPVGFLCIGISSYYIRQTP